MGKYRNVKAPKQSLRAVRRRKNSKLIEPISPRPEISSIIQNAVPTTESVADLKNEPRIQDDTPVIEGRRLISLESLVKSMNQAYEHGLSCVKKGFLEITKEKRIGLQSKLTFTCTGCLAQIIHNTESREKDTLPVNEAIVWGTYAGGSSFKASDHLCTVLDVPFPAFSTYQKYERNVMCSWDDALYETLIKNGKEEAERAKSAGQVLSVEGIEYPYTTVCVDAAWSSRSYGHSFKSKGAVAVILSKATNKLLYVGIRNRFCVMCKKQDMTGIKRQHFCFKNYSSDRSAQSMESDMILEGFRSSIAMHGLVYKRLVGDGDSSVFITLVCSNIYPGIEIEKVECVNHAVKRFTKALISVSENTQLYTLKQRNILKKNLHRFGLSLRSAIIYNHRSEEPSAALLRNDILNIPHHIFGHHDNCREYFCSEDRKSEENLVTNLIDQPIWNSIQAIISRAANNASRLLPNMTTNSAESFMNRVAKFNMGKRVNNILKGGWHLRMTTAALSFEYGPSFYTNVFKLVSNRSPGSLWKRALQRSSKVVPKSRQRARRQRFHEYRNKNVTSGLSLSTGDADYGSNPSYPDKSDEEVSKLVRELVNSKKVTPDLRNQIEMVTIGQASNSKWIFHRNGRITASQAGHLYGLRDSTNNKVTLDKLLRPQSIGHLKSVQHGQEFEGPAKRAYTAKTGNVITECGLFISLENGIFAASPDGLVGTDGIVEVKCPFSLIGHPPTDMPTYMKNSYLKYSNGTPRVLNLCRSSNYYKQIVMQLHVTERIWCDFVVYTFKIEDKVTINFDPFIERIYRNNDTLKLWNSMKMKFENFYELDIGPEIVDSRIDRNMPYKQPSYRSDAINQVEMNKKARTICKKYQKARSSV